MQLDSSQNDLGRDAAHVTYYMCSVWLGYYGLDFLRQARHLQPVVEERVLFVQQLATTPCLQAASCVEELHEEEWRSTSAVVGLMVAVQEILPTLPPSLARIARHFSVIRYAPSTHAEIVLEAERQLGPFTRLLENHPHICAWMLRWCEHGQWISSRRHVVFWTLALVVHPHVLTASRPAAVEHRDDRGDRLITERSVRLSVREGVLLRSHADHLIPHHRVEYALTT